MIERNIAPVLFQTFFVSRENSVSPMIVDIIKLGKKFEELSLKEAECNISLSYGKHLLINARDVNVEHMKQQDIVEIVDYDPIKNIVLAIGKKYPCIETPVHWIIQKARHDVHAVVEIRSKKLYETCCNHLPVTEKTPCGTIDRAKTVLKTLQNEKNICIQDEGILLAGLHLKEIEDSLIKIIEGAVNENRRKRS